MIGGLLIGLIETFWSAYFSIDYKDVAAFSILVVVLIFLPQGCSAGRRSRRCEDDGDAGAELNATSAPSAPASPCAEGRDRWRGLVAFGLFCR